MNAKRHRTGSQSQITLVEALDALSTDEQDVLRYQWGLGRRVLSDDETAEELGHDVEVVWHLQDRALQTLGYLWLTETLLPAFGSIAETA